MSLDAQATARPSALPVAPDAIGDAQASPEDGTAPRTRPVALHGPDALPAGDAVALQGLLTRHSIGPRWMVEPGPSLAQLRLAVQAALRAADHGKLQPWRAVVVGAAQRQALAERFAAFARDLGKDDEAVAIERGRAFNGPVLVAWVVRIDAAIAEVPPHEQWMCAGGALSNFLTALHLMGFGAKALSGRKCEHPAVRDAFCGAGERLAAFVCAGTPTRPAAPRTREDPDAAMSLWSPR
jgi:nitroreductase